MSEIVEQERILSEYEGGIVMFDDMLEGPRKVLTLLVRFTQKGNKRV